MYKEGSAKIKYCSKAFLNPEARFSRDISVAALSALNKGRRGSSVLDATAATGIRGIRYWKECKRPKVTMLEINGQAYREAVKNVKFNNVKAEVLDQSIQEFANTSGEKFDFVDLDPFGSAVPNVNDILKIVSDGSTLFATSTDTAVLCGAHGKACLKVYDSQPIHDVICNEVGLRILVGYLAREALKFNMGIRPLLSFSYRNHMRTLVRFERSSEGVAGSLSSIGYMGYCRKCLSYSYEIGSLPTKLLCESCGKDLQIGGKLWCGRLKDQVLANSVLKLMIDDDSMGRESVSLMGKVAGELDMVGYYPIPKVTKSMGLQSVSPDLVIKKLVGLGFDATRTHLDDSGIKTSAIISDVRKAVKSCSKMA
jgi:tRNA (guanine26-N2/guanine27-N2)-dimethyltransferase